MIDTPTAPAAAPILQVPVPDGSTALHAFVELHLHTFAQLTDDELADDDSREAAYSHLMNTFMTEIAHEIGWLLVACAQDVEAAKDEMFAAIAHSMQAHQAKGNGEYTTH